MAGGYIASGAAIATGSLPSSAVSSGSPGDGADVMEVIREIDITSSASVASLATAHIGTVGSCAVNGTVEGDIASGQDLEGSAAAHFETGSVVDDEGSQDEIFPGGVPSLGQGRGAFCTVTRSNAAWAPKLAVMAASPML